MTEQEWAEWKQHPVTMLFYRMLERQLSSTKESWVSGSFTNSNGDATLQANANAIGYAQCLEELIKMEADGLED